MSNFRDLGLKGCFNRQMRGASWMDLQGIPGFPFSEPWDFSKAVSVTANQQMPILKWLHSYLS